MQSDNKFLDMPLKYALIATSVYAVSNFLLGYIFELLATSAIQLKDGGGAVARD